MGYSNKYDSVVVEDGGVYEFIVRPHRFQNHAKSIRRHRIHPLLPMFRVNMHRVIIRPIDSCRFRIAYVHNIIDMFLKPHLRSAICPQACSSSPQQLCPGKVKQTIRSISPHTTACLNNPALFLPVRKPSRPATKARHSSPMAFVTVDACCVCSADMPNIIHFPIRDLISESHLALFVVGAGTEGFEEGFEDRGREMERARMCCFLKNCRGV